MPLYNSGQVNRAKSGKFITVLKDRNCIVCNIVFHPRFSTRKMCSTKCSGIYRSELQSNKIRVECSSCSKELLFPQSRLKRSRNLFCDTTCYSNWAVKSKIHIGEKNPLWRGGITSINAKIRTSREYKLWRTAVFQRDNYTCLECGKKNGNGKTIVLNADHIKSFAHFPKLRFDINNGRTLCQDCHRKTDTFGRKGWKLPDLIYNNQYAVI